MPDNRAPAENTPNQHTAGRPPDPAERTPGSELTTPGRDGVAASASGRRRRGSRGGARNRSAQKPQVNPTTTDTPDLPETPDLPDLPWEGDPGGRGFSTPPQVDETLATTDPPLQRRPGSTEPDQPRTQRPPQRGGNRRSGRASQVAETEVGSAQPPTPSGDPNQPLASSPAPNPAKRATSADEPGRTGRPTRPETDEPTRRRQKGRRGSQRRPIAAGDYTMCVRVRFDGGTSTGPSNATQIAVLDGRTLIEHYVSHADDDVAQIHGNIYLGRVQNVLPGMEAAFVDIATPKNAVLYRGDVQIDRDLEASESSDAGSLRIEELLRNGQLVICQVTKNPIGAKGARLTQDVSLAGRFVVLVPNSTTFGISKRLPDDERKRLRGVLEQVKPEDHGIIVRTAAAGADADDLRRDVASLVQRWTQIAAKAAKLKGPALLHREPNLAVRIIREEFSEAYRRVVIDDAQVFEEVRSYVESISPDLASRIEFFDSAAQPLPIFEQFHVHEQLHKAIDRKVWLPSGGSIIIERTEALTVIDVNTGKNVGSTSLEETVFRNNLEAATEIARQLRLRDIGGIIVIDFIDMEIRANRAALVAHFRDELAKDKTRTQVFETSELGLVEMTRKRISEGLLEALSDTCPTCNGRGFVFDPDVLAD